MGRTSGMPVPCGDEVDRDASFWDQVIVPVFPGCGAPAYAIVVDGIPGLQRHRRADVIEPPAG